VHIGGRDINHTLHYIQEKKNIYIYIHEGYIQVVAISPKVNYTHEGKMKYTVDLIDTATSLIQVVFFHDIN
jgi:hypothetical protein